MMEADAGDEVVAVMSVVMMEHGVTEVVRSCGVHDSSDREMTYSGGPGGDLDW